MISFIQALFNPDIIFVRYALIAGVVSSMPFGIIGSYVVVKRIGYVAGAISHAVLAGIGFSMYVNSFYETEILSPLTGAFAAALVAGLIISLVTRFAGEREDTIIGTVWAFGMAIGLIFIYKTPSYVDPMSYLFGNIQLVSLNSLTMILILATVIVFLTLLFYNQLLLVAYDPEFAKMRGLNVYLYEVVLILLVSVTVVLMVTSVGIVMVIALLTLPAGIASLFTKKLWHMMILSSIICLVLITAGLALSFELALPSGAVIIVICSAVYFLALVGGALTRRIKKSSRSVR